MTALQADQKRMETLFLACENHEDRKVLDILGISRKTSDLLAGDVQKALRTTFPFLEVEEVTQGSWESIDLDSTVYEGEDLGVVSFLTLVAIIANSLTAMQGKYFYQHFIDCRDLKEIQSKTTRDQIFQNFHKYLNENAVFHMTSRTITAYKDLVNQILTKIRKETVQHERHIVNPDLFRYTWSVPKRVFYLMLKTVLENYEFGTLHELKNILFHMVIYVMYYKVANASWDWGQIIASIKNLHVMKQLTLFPKPEIYKNGSDFITEDLSKAIDFCMRPLVILPSDKLKQVVMGGDVPSMLAVYLYMHIFVQIKNKDATNEHKLLPVLHSVSQNSHPYLIPTLPDLAKECDFKYNALGRDMLDDSGGLRGLLTQQKQENEFLREMIECKDEEYQELQRSYDTDKKTWVESSNATYQSLDTQNKDAARARLLQYFMDSLPAMLEGIEVFDPRANSDFLINNVGALVNRCTDIDKFKKQVGKDTITYDEMLDFCNVHMHRIHDRATYAPTDVDKTKAKNIWLTVSLLRLAFHNPQELNMTTPTSWVTRSEPDMMNRMVDFVIEELYPSALSQ